MTSMREKIARRAATAAGGFNYDGFGAETKAKYDRIADAVLDALMEPEKAMIFFGMDAMCRDDMEPTEDEFRAGFVAAILAAKEGK